MKKCTACQEIKDLELFYKRSKSPDGRQDRCKECCVTLNRKYRQENPEKVLQGVQDWRRRNPDKYKDYVKQWEQENKETRRNVYSRHKQVRRALKKTNGAVDSNITTQSVFERDQGICGICRLECSRNEASVDHIIPLSKGGTHTWDNIQLAHMLCNIKKGNRIDGK